MLGYFYLGVIMNTIYLITNLLNSKKYVGYTSFDLKDRIARHLSDAKRGSKFLIHKAIRKYGWDNFKAEEIYMSRDEDHTRKFMEPFFVTEYRAFGQYGYNMTPGGDAHGTPTRERISAAKKGKPQPWALGNKTRSNYIWITDGSETKSILKTAPIPDGFRRGRINTPSKRLKKTIRPTFSTGYKKSTKSRKPMSENHKQKAMLQLQSGKNTIWINNGTINKRIPQESQVPEGFFKGRVCLQQAQMTRIFSKAQNTA